MVTGDGYVHGPSNCRTCFPGKGEFLDLGDWRLQNNPGYYGSSDPKILILGFSKGLNQTRVAEAGSYDKIAFAGARHRLRVVLETLNLMPVDRDMDAIMTHSEPDFGVASLVRCSFSKRKNGVYKTSGDVIPSSFSSRGTLEIISACAERYLLQLPVRVRLVVLLGTGDVYIARTKALFRGLYSRFLDENSVAFHTDEVLWIYAAHPSPGNGHFAEWACGDAITKQGQKRFLALGALESARPLLRVE